MASFYVEDYSNIYDVKGLDKNFNLVLPFRNFNLPFDSEVSAFIECSIFFK